tara:strand:+ start:351 stop:803 length:453 start_codon:yes stop_codon:yes gene_type:complete
MLSVSLVSSLRKEREVKCLPLANESISAGFPSPADDYIEAGIDLNEQLIKHPISTFFLRVSGYSMTNAGINDGDLLIVDRSLEPKPGLIVVAILDGSFTLKTLTLNSGKLYLEAAHPNYPPLDISKYESIQIWGVAIYSIHSLTHIQTAL